MKSIYVKPFYALNDAGTTSITNVASLYIDDKSEKQSNKNCLLISGNDISISVRAMILDNFMYGYDESQLGDDTSFLKIGVLDSTGIMEMIDLIEKQFKVRVLDSEILPENFDSVSCISRYISGKLGLREVSSF